ncbi:hypothetical protein JXI42_13670, partial [bacterium]|nr:hypothetical protein [bacterium]
QNAGEVGCTDVFDHSAGTEVQTVLADLDDAISAASDNDWQIDGVNHHVYNNTDDVAIGTDDPGNNKLYVINSATGTATSIMGYASGASGSIKGVWGKTESSDNLTAAVYGTNTSDAIKGALTTMTTNGWVAVKGDGGYAAGYLSGGERGVYAVGSVYGAYAAYSVTPDNAFAYLGYHITDGSGPGNGDYGVYTKGDDWAGYFVGDVNITGNLTVTGDIEGDGNWVDNGDYLSPRDGSNIEIHETGASEGYIKNVEKIDVKKIDPVVQINDKQYATWVWEGIGLRTDVVGEGKLVNGIFEIDLAQQPEASDLWLFYNVVAENTIIPFVTPQDDAYLTAKMEGSLLRVKALSGDMTAKFSYRLSGKRIDMVAPAEEINRRDPNDKAKVFINVDDYDKNGGLR